MSPITRRQWMLGAAAATGVLFAAPNMHAIGPIERRGKQRLKLSLAAYSFRDSLPFPARGVKDARMDMVGFVDYSAALGSLDGVELTGYFFPDPLTADYLNQVKRRCHLAGLDISGGATGHKFSYAPDSAELEKELQSLDAWLGHYQILGAPVIRVFGGQPGKDVSAEQAEKNIIANLPKACELAGKYGIVLGIENHDFLTDIDRFLRIIEAVDSPWLGVNLDSGNLKAEGDPYAQLERIAPYAVNAQVKVMIPREGKTEPTDLDRVVKLLRGAGYSGYVVLEYEEKEDPYEAVPRYLDALRKGMGE